MLTAPTWRQAEGPASSRVLDSTPQGEKGPLWWAESVQRSPDGSCGTSGVRQSATLQSQRPAHKQDIPAPITTPRSQTGHPCSNHKAPLTNRTSLLQSQRPAHKQDVPAPITRPRSQTGRPCSNHNAPLTNRTSLQSQRPAHKQDVPAPITTPRSQTGRPCSNHNAPLTNRTSLLCSRCSQRRERNSSPRRRGVKNPERESSDLLGRIGGSIP
ncbi:hypothetical protein AAFF_G00067640 [Aldrovandia affinis]|uniref:Uncharacterized protein n=1 Tax=Aldrovandia affinis TaxID=143900 RepID=A0AAD7S1Q7_9TELE|nr:hypothetical protein AAFF_G00067640 [Aldrovandia affinis]